MAVNTKMPLTNTADGFLCEGTDIKGSYFTIDNLNNIPSTITVKGSLCYCTADSTFYQYNGSSWEPAAMGGGSGGNITIDQDYNPNSENAISGKGVAAALVEFKEEYVDPLEKMVNLTTTIMTVQMSENGTIILQNMTGLTGVDWGDGTVNSLADHTYNPEGEYKIRLYGVTIFGSNCVSFSEGSYLTAISFGGGVSQLNSYSFVNNTQLTEVNLASTISNIMYGAFEGCQSLTQIDIPTGCSSIGQFCFKGCSNLQTIKFPITITSIEQGWAYGANKLKNVTIDENNSTYSIVDGNLYNKAQTYLMWYSPALEQESFTIPNTVTSIGSYAFVQCNNLKELVTNNKGGGWHPYAIDNCQKLETIIFNANEKFPPNAISNLPNLKQIYFNGNITIASNYFQNLGEMSQNIKIIIGPQVSSLPDNFGYLMDRVTRPRIKQVIFEGDGNLLATLPANAFYEFGISEFIIPSSISSIKEKCFYNCSSLIEIIIPITVTSVGANVFVGCSTNLIIYCQAPSQPSYDWDSNWNSSGLAVIWGYGTEENQGLIYTLNSDGMSYYVSGYNASDFVGNKIVISDNINGYPVTAIGKLALSVAYAESITIPPSIKKMEYQAFGGASFKTIYISDLAAWCKIDFGDGNYSNPLSCTEAKFCLGDGEVIKTLETLPIPEGVEIIKKYAFSANQRTSFPFQEISIPDTVKTIEKYAFGCRSGGQSALTKINLGSGVETIQQGAFSYHATSSTATEGGPPVITIEGGSSVTTIGEEAFYECEYLNNYGDLLNNVEEIGSKAFAYNIEGPTSIDLPKIESIGQEAFSMNYNLTEVFLPTGIKTMGKNIFSRQQQGYNTLTIYCAEESEPEGWDDNWNFDSGTIDFDVVWSYSPPSTMMFSLRAAAPSVETIDGDLQVNGDLIITYNDEQYSLTKILELLGGYFDEAKI